jgi:hypothetical protein
MSRYNTNLKSIVEAANKIKSGGFEDPNKDKYWLAECDKVGNGSAIIRFLPSSDPDGVPFVKLYTHGFKGPGGKWYIENCPTTIGEDCPACAANGVLWNSGIESNKDIVRKRKRRLSFISNILVVSDPANPQNEGKVFLFKYGPKIFDMLVTAMQPEFADIDPVNPFDPDEGSNFHLRIRKVEGMSNFDKSSFSPPSAIDDIDSVMTQCHDLQGIVATNQFKSYAELEKKLNMVLGGEVTESVQTKPTTDRGRPSAPVAKPVPKVEDVAEEDDDLAYFRSLANADDDTPF